MAGVNYQVNGPAIVDAVIGTSGSAAPLGMCRDGISIEITKFINAIKADSGGPDVGVDQQDMGKEAVIRGVFSEYDPDYLEVIDAANAPAVGQLPNIGLPLGQNNFAIKIQIQSLAAPYLAKPWTFFTTILKRRGEKQGTDYSLINFEFFAWAQIGNAAVAVGKPLYVRSLA